MTSCIGSWWNRLLISGGQTTNKRFQSWQRLAVDQGPAEPSPEGAHAPELAGSVAEMRIAVLEQFHLVGSITGRSQKHAKGTPWFFDRVAEYHRFFEYRTVLQELTTEQQIMEPVISPAGDQRHDPFAGEEFGAVEIQETEDRSARIV